MPLKCGRIMRIFYTSWRALFTKWRKVLKNKYQTNLKLYNNRFHFNKQKKARKCQFYLQNVHFLLLWYIFAPMSLPSRFPAYCYFWVVLNMTFHNGNKNKTKAEPLSDSTSHRRQGYGQWKLPKEILFPLPLPGSP